MKQFFLKIAAALGSLCVFIGGFILPVPKENAGLRLVSTKFYTGLDAYLVGQGLATDGDYLYGSGALAAIYTDGLGKMLLEGGVFIRRNLYAMPKQFRELEVDHIGGIGVAKGRIYAACEDRAEEVNRVLIYDAETLKYTGEWYDVSNEYLTDGIPWCTVDEEGGTLYCSAFGETDKLLAFDTATMELQTVITLERSVKRVQAGAAADGVIYLNCDIKDDPEGRKLVVAVDIASGRIIGEYLRYTTGKTETEGIAAYYKGDELHLIIADYDKALSVYVREYVLDN